MPWWTTLGLGKKVNKPTQEHIRHWKSKHLSRQVQLDIYLPPAYKKGKGYPLLLINDGQDLPRMAFDRLLAGLYESQALSPFVAVGIYAGSNRMREYGVASHADYLGRGDLAGNYTRFVLEELVPFLNIKYSISADFSSHWIAGFSLGALSALDLVWSHPQHFGGAGVFSGALWWRSQAFSADDPDAHRIIHTQIEKGTRSDSQKYWFMAGTLEEADDRNKNGVIDVIDDTLDCIKALEKIGYQKKQLRYVQLEGGKHDPESWALGMRDFLLFMSGKSK